MYMNAEHPTHTQKRKRKDFSREVNQFIRDLPRFHTRESYEAIVQHIAVETVKRKRRNSEKHTNASQELDMNTNHIVRWS